MNIFIIKKKWWKLRYWMFLLPQFVHYSVFTKNRHHIVLHTFVQLFVSVKDNFQKLPRELWTILRKQYFYLPSNSLQSILQRERQMLSPWPVSQYVNPGPGFTHDSNFLPTHITRQQVWPRSPKELGSCLSPAGPSWISWPLAPGSSSLTAPGIWGVSLETEVLSHSHTYIKSIQKNKTKYKTFQRGKQE